MDSFICRKTKKGGKTLNEIFKYTKNNGEVIITGLQEGVGKTAIVIPEKIESMPVTEIAEQAFLESPITDVKIGKNIKRVGYAAFSSCHNLKSVTWNAQCGIIPEECFQFCFILSSFDFTKIKVISKQAFCESGLRTIILPNNVEEIEPCAFWKCEKLERVVWNAQTKIVPTNCFMGCSNLLSFNFTNVEVIGHCSFKECGFREVHLTSNIKKIGKGTFNCCHKLEKVIWDAKYSIVEQKCFKSCEKLSAFNFGNIEIVCNEAFSESGLKSVSLSSNVKEVENKAFSFCLDMEKVDWHSKCKSIPAHCFFGCSELSKFDFSGVNTIGKEAFRDSGLLKVNLPNNIQKVGEGAFRKCNFLKEINWDAQTPSIPSRCFIFCTSLSTFNFENIESIGEYAFTSSGLREVRLTQRTNKIEGNAFGDCQRLLRVEWLSDYSIVDKAFKNCRNLKEVNISDKVKNIATDAFEGCTNVEFAFV